MGTLTEEQQIARKEYGRQWYLDNQERIRAKRIARYETDRDAERTRNNAYYERNKDTICEAVARYKDANPELIAKRKAEYVKAHPDKHNARNRKWARANPDKINTRTARRRAMKLKATPVWADEFILSEAYHLAQLRREATRIEWHVDHIVPLQSRLVCGLHTHHNIQVIPGKENISKNNRHWPDMP
jgi:hypothetical protein